MARQRGNKWQADIIVDGKRFRPSYNTEAEALAAEAANKAAILAGEAEKKAGDTNEEGIPRTLEAFAIHQFQMIWGENSTQKDTKQNLSVIYRYIPPTTVLASVTNDTIDRMITKMMEDGYTNGTINRKLATFSKLMKRARFKGIIPFLPEITRRSEKGNQRKRVWEAEDEQKAYDYFAHCGMTDTADLCRFLIDTGCRRGEAMNLSRGDVRNGKATFRETKNGSDRVIPLTPMAQKAWDDICKRSSALKPFQDRCHGTFDNHWEKLREHFGALEDKHFVPHMLRHTCCTRLVQGGIDLPRAGKWMGHKSISMTMRYSHLVSKDLDLALATLSRRAA